MTRERASCSVWLARWTDPDTRRSQEVSLTALGLKTRDARRDWCIRKAESIATRRAAIKSGGRPAAAPMAVRTAIEDYLNRAGERLVGATVDGYRFSLEKFATWAEGASIAVVGDLTEPHLAAFRDWCMRLRRRESVAEGRRGERAEGRQRRSPVTVNQDLLRVRVFLHEARRLGRLPHLDRDSIGEGLAGIRVPRPRPAFLRAKQIEGLLRAAIRHDSDCWELTREEKDGKQPAGTTPKHDPIAPFVLFVLLSGCRRSEARTLRREYCYLDGKAPEIVLPTGATKTRHERSVDLQVAPSLVKLLKALKLRSGGAPYVFGGKEPLSREYLKAVVYRLVKTYGSPAFDWQRLRQTCATFLTNAPAIYEGASHYHSARRLGHSVTVAETRYAGLLRDISREARTLEQAMGIEGLAAEIVRGAGGVKEGDARAAAG